jgi:transcriptional regulator with XRE-family HTH domain
MSDGGTGSSGSEERELAELMQEMLTSELGELTADETADRRSVFEHWEKDFGEKMRQWRRERNWSQEDLAVRLRHYGFDMHQTTVAKIERGARPLRVAEAAAIATIFRVPTLAVFQGPPPTELPMSLGTLHERIAGARHLLEILRENMHQAAARYVDQEAEVLALAKILNQTALQAETGPTGTGRANEENQDGPEA